MMRRYLWIFILAILLIGGRMFVRRPHPDTGSHSLPQPTGAAKVNGVKILQFYPRDPVVTEGGRTVLCYGVANAKAVSINPPVETVWPSPNRCIEVQPAHDTRYVLTAEGLDGSTVSESSSIRLAADPAGLPRITSFRIDSCAKDYSGQPVFSLSFADQNAEEVSIDPPAFPPMHGSPAGKFSVKPEKTTTYTLRVTGKFGHTAKQQLIVDVSECK